MSWLCKNGHLVKHSYQAGTECAKCRNNRLRNQKRKADKKATLVVDLAELERCLQYLKHINNTELADIVWTKDGVAMEPTPEQLAEYRYMGLANRSFPEIMGWMPEDIGIRITTISINKDS